MDLIGQDRSENEITQLEVYRLAVFSMETYARKFKADGVSYDSMTALLGQVRSRAAAVDTTSEKTEKLRASVLDRLDAAANAIENAYREQVSGEWVQQYGASWALRALRWRVCR